MRHVFFALTLTITFASSAAAQDVRSEPINYGRAWNSLFDPVRLVYVQAFMEGQASTYSAVFNDLPLTSRERLRKATFLFYEPAVLRDVMTDLYKDPANTYIRFDLMVYIARDKLSGEDVTKRVQDARANGKAYEKLP
jgi:hypothetical protein